MSACTILICLHMGLSGPPLLVLRCTAQRAAHKRNENPHEKTPAARSVCAQRLTAPPVRRAPVWGRVMRLGEAPSALGRQGLAPCALRDGPALAHARLCRRAGTRRTSGGVETRSVPVETCVQVCRVACRSRCTNLFALSRDPRNNPLANTTAAEPFARAATVREHGGGRAGELV